MTSDSTSSSVNKQNDLTNLNSNQFTYQNTTTTSTVPNSSNNQQNLNTKNIIAATATTETGNDLSGTESQNQQRSDEFSDGRGKKCSLSSLKTRSGIAIDSADIDDAFNHGKLLSGDNFLVEESEKISFGSRKSFSPVLLNVFSFIFGVSCLIPWNSFITASDYFMKRIEPNENLHKIFSSTLNISNMIPLLISFFINTFLLYKYKFKIRILASMSIIFSGFLLITCLIPVDLGTNYTAYFVVIMTTSSILGSCSSFAQSAFFALAAYFDSKFMNCFMTGQGFAGLIIAIIKVIIISCQFAEEVSTGIYFGCSLFSVLVSIIGYVLVEKSSFFRKATAAHSNVAKHLEINANDGGSTKYAQNTFRESVAQYANIYKKIHIPANSLFVLCFITLAIFPGLTLQVKSSVENNDTWSEKFFTTVYCFLIFNIGDTFSRFFIQLFKWPKPNSILMLVANLLRLGFLPLFWMCNRISPNPVLAGTFTHDSIPIIIMLSFSLSNGYLMVLAFDSAPRLVESKDHEMCNTLMSLSLGLGLTAGSFTSYLISYISSFV